MKGFKKYNSFEEAEKDTLLLYASTSSQERLSRGMDLERITKGLSNFPYNKESCFVLIHPLDESD